MRRLALCALLVGAWVTGADAGTIESAGTTTDSSEFVSWRSTGVTKTKDIDAGNSYGTAGFGWFMTGGYSQGTVAGDPLGAVGFDGSSTKTFATTGLSYTNIAMNKSYWGYGYPDFDNPEQPVSSNVSDTRSGVAGFGEGTTNAGQYYDAFSINIGDGFTADSMRLGLWITLQNGNYLSSAVQLRQTIGGISTVEYASPVAGANGYFFDISGIAIGDQYVVSLMHSTETNGAMTFSGFTLDTVTPEPTSISAIGLTFVGLLSRRRRKL